MIQYIKLPERNPSFGQQIGHAIGSGAGKGFSSALEEKQKSAKNKKTAESLGIPPEVFDLPEAAQDAFFKQHYASEKKMTDLQKKQLDLAQERLDASKSKRSFFNQLTGNQEDQKGENQPNVGRGIMANNAEGMQQEPSQENIQKKITSLPKEKLQELSGFAGQPGDMGIVGNIAKSELDRQKQEEDRLHQYDIENRRDVRDSFKDNQAFIDKTYDQWEDSNRKEAIFERMDQLEESGEMSGSGMINALESIGLRPEWLQNPANEEYNKLGLDLLGGGTLQADYGSRIFASEFKVSQQRIPTLSQTPEGRKQIKENLRTFLLPSKLKKERMEYYLEKQRKTGKPLPNNLRGRILKDIKPQLEEAYDKFKQRNGRYKVREGTVPDDDALEKYYYIAMDKNPKAQEKDIIKLMEEDGYSFD